MHNVSIPLKKNKNSNVPVLPECTFSPLFYLADTLHTLDCLLHQFAVVADWDVSSLFKVDCRVLEGIEDVDQKEADKTNNSHLLASRLPECFCPPNFAWITLHSAWMVRFDTLSKMGKHT